MSCYTIQDLTQNAVEMMLNNTVPVKADGTLESILLVQISSLEHIPNVDDYRKCILFDGKQHSPALIHIPSNTNLIQNYNFDGAHDLRDFIQGKFSTGIIGIDGFITSEANMMWQSGFTNLLCIITFSYFVKHPCLMSNTNTSTSTIKLNQNVKKSKNKNNKNTSSNNNNKKQKINHSDRVMTFYSNFLPFFSNEDLAGCSTCNFFGNFNQDLNQKISLFFIQHKALSTLYDHSNSSSSSNTSNGGNTDNNTYVATNALHHDSTTPSYNKTEEISSQQSPSPSGSTTNTNANTTTTSAYFNALRSFSASQLERQSASLTTNTEKEDATRSVLVVLNHTNTLQLALDHAANPHKPSLTPQTLCQWHEALGANNLIPNAGTYRRKQVKTGVESHTPIHILSSELEQYCNIVRTLESRLLALTNSFHHEPQERNKYGYGPITFAAIVMFGLLNIHPFSDGNGRLSRILVNWALRRAGFPFVINLCATHSQRTEYISAIRQTTRNLRIVHHGIHTDIHDCIAISHFVGIFQPIVSLLMDRVSKALLEFDNLVQEKSKSYKEEEEERAARKIRELAAAGSCLICLDDKPNVATLCCGKAVHLNCIAQWLSSNNSCPQCRGELPPLQSSRIGSSREGNDDRTSDGLLVNLQHNLNELANRLIHDIQAEDISFTSSTMHHDTTSETDEDEYGSVTIQIRDETEASQSDDEEMDETETEIANDDGDETEEMGNASSSDDDDEIDCDDTTSMMDDEDEEIDETTAHLYDDNNEPSFVPNRCIYGRCHNYSAVDCSNKYCGRCCSLFGHLSCSRHGI